MPMNETSRPHLVDVNDQANHGLVGKTYSSTCGGTIAPFSGASAPVPLPPGGWLLLSGLGGLAVISRRRSVLLT